MKEVYCKNCKNLRWNKTEWAVCKKGIIKMDWFGKSHLNTFCHIKNENKDCPDYEPTLFAEIFEIFRKST